MLTPRARWILAAGVLFIAVGLLSRYALLAVLGLAVILWITGEALLFLYRMRWVARRLTLRRQVRDDRGPVASFWANRSFEVRLVLMLDGQGSLPYLALDEPVPFGLDVTTGEPRGEGVIDADNPVEVRYHVKAARPGCVRFEGVRVQLADLHGLFYHVAFVRLVETYRVLPSLVDAEGKTATSKRYNLLPPPGIHRLHRPGAGSELLDLRDYMPGDPPKTIAWKVSARRDKLITREYESEVPIRCTLFIDTSQSVRLGPPGKNALARLVEIASGVAQANLSSRDLTGLCLFDEEKTRILKPARTRRHLVEVFNQLADAAGLTPAAGRAAPDVLVPLACAFAQEVYPEQFDAGVNHVPGWLPFFVPTPGHWVTPRTAGTRFYRWVFCGAAAISYAIVGLTALVQLTGLFEEIPQGIREELLPPVDFLALGLFLAICFGFPIWMMLWRDALPLLFAPARRRQTRMRKKLAALFAARYELGGGGVELLLQDDLQMGVYLERFLSEHHVPHTPQLYDRQGRYLFASPGKIDVLAAALLRAIGKGHDNELFVLFVDLVELGPKLEPLLRAVKVALARHHQVMVVLPWPFGLDPPGREEAADVKKAEGANPAATRGAETRKRFARQVKGAVLPDDVRTQVKKRMAKRYVKAFHKARRTFARLQVPVICADDAESIALILDRVDRLRGLRRRR